MLKASQCDCSGEAKRWWTLTVQSPADGEVDLTDSANWTTQGTIKAYFVSRGGGEHMQANKVEGVRHHTLETVSTGFSRAIIPKWRMLLGSRTIQITSVHDINEERRTVQIQGTEKV